MQTVLYLDIDPTVLADLLRALSVHGEVLAIRAGQDALAIGAAVGTADETTIRRYLTTLGLTPRQCDLVVLDLQGHSRTEIAEMCGVSPATVKKYWAAIYARLDVESRPMLRACILADCGLGSIQPMLGQGIGWPNTPPNYPPTADYPAEHALAILDGTAIRQTDHE
jgi:DNA-binding NarL/FixJ family response regulator